MAITLVNIKDVPTPKDDIYIGRKNTFLGLPASKWANPFVMKNESEREDVIAKYEEYILGREDLLQALPELDGKILGCYCFPKKCHGDVLIKLFNIRNGIRKDQ